MRTRCPVADSLKMILLVTSGSHQTYYLYTSCAVISAKIIVLLNACVR